jgi:hypothetical protein
MLVISSEMEMNYFIVHIRFYSNLIVYMVAHHLKILNDVTAKTIYTRLNAIKCNINH